MKNLQENKIVINHKIYQFYDYGHGDTSILFLHGLASSKKMFPRFFDSFLDEYRCLFIDLPAHNKIPNYGIESLDEISQYVINFIDYIKPSKLIIIGFSFGGLVGLNTTKILKERGDDIKVVVWASPLKKSFLTLRSKSFFKVVDGLKNKKYKKLPGSIYFRFLVALLGIKVTNKELETFKFFENSNLDSFEKLIPRKMLPTKDIKVLYIYGTNDPLIKTSAFKNIKLTNKFQEKHLIKKGGHNLDKKAKEDIHKIIKTFINKEEKFDLFGF